ncbi:PEP/pyruvate-binding domain-containing protein [Pseudonocardia saturnea]
MIPASAGVAERVEILGLADIAAEQSHLVGGKAAGLAAMIRAGERVPDGFCITTAAHDRALAAGGRLDQPLSRRIVAAYQRLGAGSVAVRSSATAEDLPLGSFAGQHDTVLDVDGERALIEAVHTCWASLSSPRALAYRTAAGVDDATVRMAVVVQRMVDPSAAGVLFTANPITGCRTEMVVDAVAGLGDVVVDGSVAADHYVLDGSAGPVSGCLDVPRLRELREAGTRLQQRADTPQDVEWAFDHDGRLWLLQSRPITTLFPQPTSPRPGPRVYLEAGHVQGMLRPFTPMGMSAMRVATAQSLAGVGIPADPFVGHPGLVGVAGRMYIDITALVRNRAMREQLPASMTVYGPRVSAAVGRVLDDPRFAPVPGRPYRLRTVVPVVVRLAPGMIAGLVGAIIRPAHARTRALRAAATVRRAAQSPPAQPRTAGERLHLAMDLQGTFLRVGIRDMLPPIYAGLVARQVAIGLLAGVASESEIDETLRGMPHNVTTGMDLDLWRLAAAATPHRDLLLHTAPAELAARYRAGTLPDIGLDEFLRAYGHRGAAEVDVGLPRWAEDPTPVFAAVAGYLRVVEPGQAPDLRFARAAADAQAKIDELVARATRSRPVRARVAGFLMRRGRAIAGLRELPKFAWLHALDEMRRQLLAAGADLQERGMLERADDIMFLDFREALIAADGHDQCRLVATRRAAYDRELARRSVPGVLLSDGTNPEALAPSTPADGALTGMPAAPGTATGPARVIRDPTTAHIEPGEILVAPTTDPGWTPLFLTAGGLVTETGSPMAHGPTVAREYGIPAVICVRDATELITTGQLVTIDGAAGTVTLTDGAGVPDSSTSGPRIRP